MTSKHTATSDVEDAICVTLLNTDTNFANAQTPIKGLKFTPQVGILFKFRVILKRRETLRLHF